MIGFTSEVRIDRPLDEVFAYVSDPLNFPQWNSAVEAVRQTEAGAGGVAASYLMERQLPNGRAVNELEIVGRERPHEFAIRATAGPTPFLYRYRFTGANGETLMTLEARVELAGPAALLSRLAERAVKRGVDDNLATLKRILEAGR